MPAWFVDEVARAGAEHMATIPTPAFALATNDTGMRSMAPDQAEQMLADEKRDSVLGNTARLFTARSFTVRRRSSLPPYTHAQRTHA